MGEPGLSMGLVTTCSVGVDLETRTTLFQSISTFCSLSWAAAGKAHNATVKEANKVEVLIKRSDELITCSSVLNAGILVSQVRFPYALRSFAWAVVRGCHL